MSLTRILESPPEVLDPPVKFFWNVDEADISFNKLYRIKPNLEVLVDNHERFQIIYRLSDEQAALIFNPNKSVRDDFIRFMKKYQFKFHTPGYFTAKFNAIYYFDGASNTISLTNERLFGDDVPLIEIIKYEVEDLKYVVKIIVRAVSSSTRTRTGKTRKQSQNHRRRHTLSANIPRNFNMFHKNSNW